MIKNWVTSRIYIVLTKTKTLQVVCYETGGVQATPFGTQFSFDRIHIGLAISKTKKNVLYLSWTNDDEERRCFVAIDDFDEFADYYYYLETLVQRSEHEINPTSVLSVENDNDEDFDCESIFTDAPNLFSLEDEELELEPEPEFIDTWTGCFEYVKRMSMKTLGMAAIFWQYVNIGRIPPKDAHRSYPTSRADSNSNLQVSRPSAPTPNTSRTSDQSLVDDNDTVEDVPDYFLEEIFGMVDEPMTWQTIAFGRR